MDTDIQKAMLARPVPGLAEFLQVHSQASLQVALGLRGARESTAATEHRPPAFAARMTSIGQRPGQDGGWQRAEDEEEMLKAETLKS